LIPINAEAAIQPPSRAERGKAVRSPPYVQRMHPEATHQLAIASVKALHHDSTATSASQGLGRSLALVTVVAANVPAIFAWASATVAICTLVVRLGAVEAWPVPGPHTFCRRTPNPTLAPSIIMYASSASVLL